MALQDLLALSNSKKKIGISEERIEAVKPILRKYAALWREYPDLLVDFLVYGPKVITGEEFTPEEQKENESKFKFFFYQRCFLRAVMRYQYVYATFPRAYSKSFLTVLALILKCILYPGAHLFVTSGGKQQSAEILSQKVQELCRLIPPLEREINWSRGKTQEGKDYVKYIFKNGSVLDNLAAKESSRGQRRHGGSIEECVGVDDKILREVIIPVMAVPRRALDGTTCETEPVNKSQIYITTAGYKGTYSYDRLIGLLVRMVMQPERCIVLGGTWRTPVAMGLQSKTFITDQKEEGTFNEASFEREFESRWSGTTEDAYFNQEIFARNRVLNQPEYEASGRSSKLASYVISVDVARFKGCDTVFCIFKSTPQPQGIPLKTLVNMYTMNDEHFEDQAIFLKGLYFKYNASRIVIDGNGNGAGLVDYMVKPQIVQETKEVLPPFGVYNDDKAEYTKYKTNDTVLDAMYIIKANAAINSEAHVNAKSQLASGRVKLLIDPRLAQQKLLAQKTGQNMTSEQRAKYLLPFNLTSILGEEMANLREENEGANINLKQVNKRIRKDKFSSFEYGLYYLKLEEDKKKKKKKFVASDWAFFN